MTDRKRLPEAAVGDSTRRAFLLTAGAACAGACGASVGGRAGDAAPDVSAPDVASPADVAAADATPGDAVAADAQPFCDEDGWFELGPVSNYPVGTHVVDSGLNMIVTRDARGIWAMRRTCPHQFGQIDTRPDGTNVCGNTAGGYRGATFDADGRMLVPPRSAPSASIEMGNLAVRVCGGGVWVAISRSVPAGTRAAV